MSGTKRRVKTGCITCRQRRVKCDERKPFCHRCEVANISCDGYIAPRHVDKPRKMKNQSRNIEESMASPTSHITISGYTKPESLLFAYPQNPTPSQRPHQRARELLGHQQYASRSAQLLFRQDHLYFWRDHVLTMAWDTECIFDAVISLGLMHRAVIMLSSPDDKWRGLDNKVVAFQIYATALGKLSEACTEANGRSLEIIITTLLLLTRFECFANNHTAAFRHLRLAQSYLEEATPTHVPNIEPLAACVSEFGLVVQVLLPLPFVNNPYRKAAANFFAPSETVLPRNGPDDLQELLNIICSHTRINIAVWSSLCNTEDKISYQELETFQETLTKWRSQSISLCQEESEFLDRDQSIDSLNLLPIPPKPRLYPSLNAALAAATFHGYMGRTLCMMSVTSTNCVDDETLAIKHAYQMLRILQGLEQEKNTTREHCGLLSCYAFRIGFIPLLFLAAQFCLNAKWIRFTIEKIRFIGQEGLYSGEMFASALQSLELFQTHAQELTRNQSLHHTDRDRRFKIVPILIPGPQEKSAVAYYIRAHYPEPQESLCHRMKSVQIVGRARWQRSIDDASTNVSLEFFDPDHTINDGLKDRCLYLQIATNEPVAQEWETFLGPEALGRHGYFVHLAASRSAETAMET